MLLKKKYKSKDLKDSIRLFLTDNLMQRSSYEKWRKNTKTIHMDIGGFFFSYSQFKKKNTCPEDYFKKVSAY